MFIWVGALKIAAGSAGTATAGALIGGVSSLPVIFVAVLTVVAALICAIDRARNVPSRGDEVEFRFNV